jgi:hypothetical protein
VKWTVKIAPKRSYPTAGKKIWGDLVLKTEFSKIQCKNMFSAEVDRLTFLVDRLTHYSPSINRLFVSIDRHAVHSNFLLFKSL